MIIFYGNPLKLYRRNEVVSLLFREAVSKRIYELCIQYNYTPNKLAELSLVAPSTLQGITSAKVTNPSSYVIYQICKTLKITIKDFFDSDLFLQENLDD